LPMARGQDPASTEASWNEVPTLMVNNHRSVALQNELRSFNADLAVVCCYPKRIPVQLIETCTFGGINLHPSLLPKYRGPEPLFWIYKHGQRQSGVTIHQVDHGLDTGHVLAQDAIEIPVGTSGNELWNQSAHRSANLLIDLLNSTQEKDWAGTPQDEQLATYFSWPQYSDLLVEPASWDAWRLFHFVRGAVPFGYIPIIESDMSVRKIVNAHGYVSVDCASELPGTEIECRDGRVFLEFANEESPIG
jgi:methionyl-tRNA formyltransferase